MDALSRAFKSDTDDLGFCKIGSVKSNIGHLDVAAGMAGLIKVVLAIHHKKIPPTVNYQSPNPQLRIAETPFSIANELCAWPNTSDALIAGVNSLGMGGTNAHAIIANSPIMDSPIRQETVLSTIRFSAKTTTALNKQIDNVEHHLKHHPDLAIQDVAYTLRHGRSENTKRCVAVCSTTEELVALLETNRKTRIFSIPSSIFRPRICLLYTSPSPRDQRGSRMPSSA